MESKSGSGFAELKMLTDMVADMARKYGQVEVDEPKKRKERSYLKAELSSTIRVVNPDNDRNYLQIKLNPNEGKPVTKISIYVLYANPSLNGGYGTTYDIPKKSFEYSDGLKSIETALDKTFGVRTN